jgi:hypothetical protein
LQHLLAAAAAVEHMLTLRGYTWEFGEVGAVHSDSSSDSGSESSSDDSADDSNTTKASSRAQQSAVHCDRKATTAANDDADDDEQLEKHEIRMQLPLAALQAAAGAATSFELVFDEHTAPVIRKLASASAV